MTEKKKEPACITTVFQQMSLPESAAPLFDVPASLDGKKMALEAQILPSTNSTHTRGWAD